MQIGRLFKGIVTNMDVIRSESKNKPSLIPAFALSLTGSMTIEEADQPYI